MLSCFKGVSSKATDLTAILNHPYRYINDGFIVLSMVCIRIKKISTNAHIAQ